MVKRYYFEQRPEGRTIAEQSKINSKNWDDFQQGLVRTLQEAEDLLNEREKTSAYLSQSLENGEIAFSYKEVSVLEFNDDYTVAKYGNKMITFVKGGFESEILRILLRTANGNVGYIKEEQLVGSLERATGKTCIYKTVRNARSRLNKKFDNMLGLVGVIGMRDGKYWFERRYLKK